MPNLQQALLQTFAIAVLVLFKPEKVIDLYYHDAGSLSNLICSNSRKFDMNLSEIRCGCGHTLGRAASIASKNIWVLPADCETVSRCVIVAVLIFNLQGTRVA